MVNSVFSKIDCELYHCNIENQRIDYIETACELVVLKKFNQTVEQNSDQAAGQNFERNLSRCMRCILSLRAAGGMRSHGP